MTLGLCDLYMATCTETASGETYGTPEKLAEAMTAELSVTTADGTLYADDHLSESASEFAKATLKLGVKDLTPAMLAKLLGQQQDGNDVLWASGNDVVPKVAVGFRAKKSGGRYRYVWLLKGSFKIPSEKYETKGDSITFNTPEIEGEFGVDSNGRWKADFVGVPTDTAATSWFTSVPSWVAPTPTPNGSGSGH